MDSGTVGGILGGALGTLGGVVGTYFSITSTESAPERRFMVRCAIIGWVGVVAFLALLFWLSTYGGNWHLVPCLVLWPAPIFAVHYCNRRQQEIREGERAKRNQIGSDSETA
jgi:hypothetical protein